MRFDPRPPRNAGPRENPGGCPSCDGGWRTIQFNWKLALAEPGGDWGRYPATLRHRKAFRRGSLYDCPNCGQAWYLDGAQEMMTVVPPGKAPLLERWGGRPQPLADPFWVQARAIGATPPHRYAADPRTAEVPCRVMTKEGGPFDRCLVLFSLDPPLAYQAQRILLAEDLTGLEPSDLALPLSLRRACATSTEGRMGLAPTGALSADGRRFLLNWTVNFFDQDGLKGKDLRLGPIPPGRISGKVPVVDEALDRITLILADWSPRVGELLGV